MKTGKSLQELAAELDRQSKHRADYIAPQGKLTAIVNDKREVVLDGLNGGTTGIESFAHGQIATNLEIPQKYYDRMRTTDPELLATNINAWMKKDPAEKRMVRTVDNRVRAWLSPRYRPLDNYDLAQTVLPVLLKHNAQIVSSELTDTRMYIKCILPSLSDTIPVGTLGQGHQAVDRGTVVAAVVISNSEVGAGSLRVEPSVFTTFCTNLAIIKESTMKKYHVGRSHDVTENGYEVFRDETRMQDDKAFFLKVGDVTMAAFDVNRFRAAVAKIKETAANPITSDDLPAVVVASIVRLSLPESLGGSILTQLAKGGDLSQWGLSSAITRVAGDVADYEEATMIERAGGEVLSLHPNDWKRIAEAA